MTMIAQAELPHSQEVRLTAEQVVQQSEHLLRYFGIETNPESQQALEKPVAVFNPRKQPKELQDHIKQLNPRFTGERHYLRYELEQDDTQWPEDTRSAIMATAEGLNMLKHETPLVGHHDVAIVLAGARQATLDRLQHVVDAVKEGRATVGQIVVVGCARRLKDKERENVKNYAPHAQTEFDLCLGAVGVVAKQNPGIAISPIFVEKERADTPSVVEATLQTLKGNGTLPKRPKIAAITNQIYEPATTLDVTRVAKQFGIKQKDIFVAGAASDLKIVKSRTPATYLAEIVRVLRAATNEIEATNVAKRRVGNTAARAQFKVIGERADDGSLLVAHTDGSRWVQFPNGTSWRRYSVLTGLVFDDEHDTVGHPPTEAELRALQLDQEQV